MRKRRNKALVDFEFDAGADRLIYTATFRRSEGRWMLCGVRETLQEFAPPLVVINQARPAPPELPPPPKLLPATITKLPEPPGTAGNRDQMRVRTTPAATPRSEIAM